MLGHAFKHNTWRQRQVEFWDFQACLIFAVGSRLAKAI